MTNTEYAHQLTPEKNDYFDQLEPAYSVQLDALSELVVTPQAHDFYGLEPRIDTMPGRVTPAANTEPYTQVIFAAPTEVATTKVIEKDVFYSTTADRCRFALTVPQTPDEYVALGRADYCRIVRAQDWRSRSDEQILETMDPALGAAMEAELRAGHVADFIKMLSPLLMPRIAYMREHSSPQNQQRKQLLAQRGIQISVVYDSGVESFKTVPKVAKYSMRRADEISRLAFRVFCDRKYDFLLQE